MDIYVVNIIRQVLLIYANLLNLLKESYALHAIQL